MSKKALDIVVWGCTGFTGRLACEYIERTYPHLKWAIAGRNAATMNALKNDLHLPPSVEVIVADISDKTTLRDMASRTKVVLSTAGPFAKIGTPIVEACIFSDAHYCDITGEAPWVRDVVDKYFEEA